MYNQLFFTKFYNLTKYFFPKASPVSFNIILCIIYNIASIAILRKCFHKNIYEPIFYYQAERIDLGLTWQNAMSHQGLHCYHPFRHITREMQGLIWNFAVSNIFSEVVGGWGGWESGAGLSLMHIFGGTRSHGLQRSFLACVIVGYYRIHAYDAQIRHCECIGWNRSSQFVYAWKTHLSLTRFKYNSIWYFYYVYVYFQVLKFQCVAPILA